MKTSQHRETCRYNQAEQLNSTEEKKIKLSAIFNKHWDNYSKHPKRYITPEQYKAVNSIRTCQTAVLGVDIYCCKSCGEITEKYHTCKHRFCPSCSWNDTLKWADNLLGRMMNIKHRHVVFTLPHELNPLIRKNKKIIFNLFMRLSAEMLKDWIRYKYKVSCGIITVLHTFCEKKEFHVHVHMIVSWGGEDIVTGELREISSNFIKYDKLTRRFRKKFVDELVKLYTEKKLEHKFADEQEFSQLIKRVHKDNWIVHIEPPMQSAKEVIVYIGRYSKRACISEYKITNIDGEIITFKYKDNKDKGADKLPKIKELPLHYTEFFPRILQHVPLPYFKIVRYYGKYHPKSKIKEEYLYKNNQALVEPQEEENTLLCKTCNILPEYLYTIFDLRKREERTEEFDMSKHAHVKLKRLHMNRLKIAA